MLQLYTLGSFLSLSVGGWHRVDYLFVILRADEKAYRRSAWLNWRSISCVYRPHHTAAGAPRIYPWGGMRCSLDGGVIDVSKKRSGTGHRLNENQPFRRFPKGFPPFAAFFPGAIRLLWLYFHETNGHAF